MPCDSNPASAKDLQPAMPASSRLVWTSAHRARATKQRQALNVVPLDSLGDDASAIFAQLHADFVTSREQEFTRYLASAPTVDSRLSDVLRIYGNPKMPSKLDVTTEATAFSFLSPRWNVRFRHTHDAAVNQQLRMLHFWVAHTGLPFALEAFAQALRPSKDKDLDAEASAIHSAGLFRVFRAYLAGASSHAYDAAYAKAQTLRTVCAPRVQSAITTVFLNSEWINTDLQRCAGSVEQALFDESAFLHATDTSALADHFATMSLAQASRFIPWSEPWLESFPFCLALLAQWGEAAIEPLACWVKQLARLAAPASSPRYLFRLVNDILEALELVHESDAVSQAAVHLLSTLHGQVINKDEDPRPAAISCLRHVSVTSLPRVRDAAKCTGGGWAQDLAPQLERSGNPPTLDTAPLVELPCVLTNAVAFKAPSFWLPQAFSPPQILSGKALPPRAMTCLGAMLSHDATDEIAVVRKTCTAASLADFAWDLFQAWLSAGAPAKGKWAFTALGHLGNDDCARRLARLIRLWPGEMAHQRAVLGIDILAQIGSNVALVMLNSIAQKTKFKGLKGRAQQKMQEVANKHGLDPEALADRLVPDLGLQKDGSLNLDFGPRSFRVSFDGDLKPCVMDEKSKCLKDLPKPNSQDNADLAHAALATWKTMKKDARVSASLERLRLELSMSNQRRWQAEDFHTYLVGHPWLSHWVKRLVWGTFSQTDKLLTTFQVKSGGSYALHTDEVFDMPPDIQVGLVHRLMLCDADSDAWLNCFHKLGRVQPFEQLMRRVFTVDSQNDGPHRLDRFVGRVVETKKLLGLQDRGWHRGAPQDAGAISWLYKPVTANLNACVYFSEGILVSAVNMSDSAQTLGSVDFGSTEPQGRARSNPIPMRAISNIVLSEVIRDLELLGRVAPPEHPVF